MKSNPVVWFEIYVEDMPGSRAFYETVLGGSLSKLDSPDADLEMFTFPMEQNASGAGGALCRMKRVSSGGNSTMVYFGCDDCAIASDPEGNVFGLHSMV